MKALASTSKWLCLGLGGWVVLACSAEASEPPPQPYNPTANVGGGGSGGGNTAGASNLPIAGTSTGVSGSTGSGGTSPGTAGTTGAAGTTGTAGMGAGGGGALASCPVPPATGTLADAKIDDFEDGDNGVLLVGSRTGFWYTYMDTFGLGTMIMPPQGNTPLTPGTTNCHGGMRCVIISGTTAMADTATEKYPYAGLGVDFSNAKNAAGTGGMSCKYNGGAYTGIKFWARGEAQIRVKLNVASTTGADGGGTCVPVAGDMPKGCNDGFGMDLILTPDWAEQDIPFASLMQEGWGVVGTLDKASLLAVQIQFPPGQTFNVAFDDFTFY